MDILRQIITRNNISHFNTAEITKGKEIPEELQWNIERTLIFLDMMRKDLGFKMLISNSYRTWEDHLDIYKSLGKTLSQVPKRSLHLMFNAVDVMPLSMCKKQITEMHDYVTKKRFFGMGVGYYPWGLHLDTRGVLGRRSATWGKRI